MFCSWHFKLNRGLCFSAIGKLFWHLAKTNKAVLKINKVAWKLMTNCHKVFVRVSGLSSAGSKTRYVVTLNLFLLKPTFRSFFFIVISRYFVPAILCCPNCNDLGKALVSALCPWQRTRKCSGARGIMQHCAGPASHPLVWHWNQNRLGVYNAGVLHTLLLFSNYNSNMIWCWLAQGRQEKYC